MKKAISGLLSLSLAIMLTFSAEGVALSTGHQSQNVVSHQVSDHYSQEIIGGGWGQFFDGVMCGVGIVAIAAGGASGVGAVGATLLVGGTIAACGAALLG